MASLVCRKVEKGVDFLKAKILHQKAVLFDGKSDTNMLGPGLWSMTEMKEETFEFDWIVKGFSAFGCNEVVSDTFKGPRSQYSWQLTMKPRVRLDVDGEEYMVLYLCQTEVLPSAQKLNARFTLSLRDSKGRLGNYAGSKEFHDFRDNRTYGCDNFIWFADLIKGKRPWLHDDTLRVHCSMVIEGEVQHETGPGIQPKNASLEANKDKTLEDFGRLMREGGDLFADVEVVTGTKTLKVHKAILGARSSVFQTMFTTPMAEAKSGTVKIKDFDKGTVKGMLEYIYTGQVVNLKNHAQTLLQIADKYDLPGLKAMAEVSIVESLSVDNAADTLVLAHMVNASFLKSKVFEFMNRNKEGVKKSDGFQRLAKSNADGGILSRFGISLRVASASEEQKRWRFMNTIENI